MASLATAMNYIDHKLDPVWLMGSSAFAFRIYINETFCLSAMSIFSWDKILPEAVEQYGRTCRYISRMWHEEDVEIKRRQEAHKAIVEAIDNNTPAIVWDIKDAEWGLIVGYDDQHKKYDTMTYKGMFSYLDYEKLGRNGINILSVTIPGDANSRDKNEAIRNSLKAAVAHAEQQEWNDRPEYQDGLPAYDLWAMLFERWAMLTEAGKAENLPKNITFFAKYYAGHYYSARCYARDYLNTIKGDDSNLNNAFESYKKVALLLQPVWDNFAGKPDLSAEKLRSLSATIKSAKEFEEAGIGYIKEWLRE
ncbi:MAG: hypothetical protein ABIJ12_06130 [bacterium]